MSKDGSEIVYRRMRPGDEACFGRILPEVFDHAIRPEWLAAHLASSTHFLACAFDGDAVVAMVMANLHLHPDKPNELYIDELGTSPEYRKRGIATRLMEEAIGWGRELGCKSCWVGTELNNKEARAVYTKWQSDPDEFLLFEFDL